MKKLMVSLLALLLPLCAGAETVREQIRAPEAYQNTYYSNTARTQITVDAAVFVPDVACIPTYAVTVRDFTADEAWKLAGLTEPDQDWGRWESDGELPSNMLTYRRSGQNNELESTYIRLSPPKPSCSYIALHNDYAVGVFSRQPTWRRLEYEWADPETNLFFYPHITFLHPETVGKSLDGQPLTVEEATALADGFMARMAPEYQRRFVAGTQGEKGDGKFYKHLAYCFGYTRTVGGVPITCAEFNHYSTQPADIPMAPAPGQELIILVVHENKIVNFSWQDPYEIGEVMQATTHLMPFEQIMGVFGAIAPLSVQNTENDMGRKSQANNGMRINEIRLGYMPVLQRDNPNQWELRPVWDFIGARILPRETYDWPCYSLMTIDAIDGTVIDRSYGY